MRPKPRPSKQRIEKFEIKKQYNSTADPVPKKKKTKLGDLGDSRIYEANDSGAIAADLPNESMEQRVAFCCFQCFCPEKIKKKIPTDDPFIQSSSEGLYHRRCCHNVFEPDENWASPYEIARETIQLKLKEEEEEEEEEEEVVEEILHNVITLPELERQCKIAMRNQDKMYDDDQLPDPSSLLQSVDPYNENQKKFQKIDKSEEAMVVLDMFAGIGSGIVALKRLSISMKKIIHVEHDPVANHVYKWNHDPMYNDSGSISGDNIEHVYIEKFEDFEENMEDYLSKHGPIDFVIGGPPCVDYSGLNAYREGAQGKQGGYMPRFGTLIQRIQQRQPSHHVFFLAENTIIRNDKELSLKDGDLERIKESFGVEWSMDLEALYYTPARRNRTYFSNIPLDIKSDDYVLDEELDDCPYLTDEFVHGIHYMLDQMKKPRIPVKVPCLLACKSRIDADPMTVVKENIGNEGEPYIERRPFNVKERELVMGFPTGYVEEAVNELFQNLVEKGYGNTILAHYETNWKNGLPEKYHIFGGLPVRFYSSDYSIRAKLQPPRVNTVNDFYDHEQYGKRLIGNAFSVPVVEILLRELQKKFPKREYNDYSYSYVWRTSRVRIKGEDDS